MRCVTAIPLYAALTFDSFDTESAFLPILFIFIARPPAGAQPQKHQVPHGGAGHRRL